MFYRSTFIFKFKLSSIDFNKQEAPFRLRVSVPDRKIRERTIQVEDLRSMFIQIVKLGEVF